MLSGCSLLVCSTTAVLKINTGSLNSNICGFTETLLPDTKFTSELNLLTLIKCISIAYVKKRAAK